MKSEIFSIFPEFFSIFPVIFHPVLALLPHLAQHLPYLVPERNQRVCPLPADHNRSSSVLHLIARLVDKESNQILIIHPVFNCFTGHEGLLSSFWRVNSVLAHFCFPHQSAQTTGTIDDVTNHIIKVIHQGEYNHRGLYCCRYICFTSNNRLKVSFTHTCHKSPTPNMISTSSATLNQSSDVLTGSLGRENSQLLQGTKVFTPISGTLTNCLPYLILELS